MMGKIKNENFLVIQGWMVNELDLKGTELLCYAVIYGFSQDGEHKFTGTRRYLAEWCNCTPQNVQKALNSLVDKGYITKYEHYVNNVKMCEYSATIAENENDDEDKNNKTAVTAPCNNQLHGETTVTVPSKKKCYINNINNNINNNKSFTLVNDLYLEKSGSDYQFGKTKQKKKSLYENCSEMILAFTNNKNLQDNLFDYLDFILKKSKEENKSFFANNFKGMLNQLNKLSKTDDECIDIVSQSIVKGYWGFYSVNNNFKGKNNTVNHVEGISKDNSQMYHKLTEEEFWETRAKDENGNYIEF